VAKIPETFYFGPESTRLFGAWYPPDPSVVKTTGIVICPHMGQEGHLLRRRLAVVLSGCGYPVLRFDYLGTGDSSGESWQATIEQWLDDIDTAVGKMERRAGCSDICLVGVRFGGTLAFLYGSLRRKLYAIAALNPVNNGRAHIAELRELETEAWRAFADAPAERLEAEQAQALMGAAYGEQFLVGLEAVDLMSLKARPADHIGLFDGGVAGPSVSDLRSAPAFAGGFDHLEAGTRTDDIFGDDHWTPGQAPRAISDWLLTTCP
jgi:pimeloyl-ACP methyl ester carboxylesterase